MALLAYCIRRMAVAVVVLWIIATITFVFMYSLPGSPFLGDKPLPPVIEQNLMERYGLNEPLGSQYLSYMHNLLQGDLGPSYVYHGRSVNQLLAEAFPYSALLGALALVAALVLGVPWGLWGALTNDLGQQLFIFITTLGVALPNIVIAPLLVYFFAQQLGWFPAAMWGGPANLVLPILSLALLPATVVSRLVRASLLDVLGQEYLQTARAKGLEELAVICRHALPNALIPVLSYLGPLMAAILTGSFVMERVFALPGLGEYFARSIPQRDYGLLMGVTLFYSTLLVVLNLVLDLLCAWLDPRFAHRVTDWRELGR